MIFDTDILIWIQRGHSKAADVVEKSNERYLSIQSYMELLQGAKNKQQHRYINGFISDFNVIILPLTENIGHRALIYVEQHSLSSNMRAGDAIIAATAVENNLPLCSSNIKHYKVIEELDFIPFYPN